MKDLVRLIRTLAWTAFVAAIYQELRKPPEARTWNGKVAGVVPYDFRIPTLDRLREERPPCGRPLGVLAELRGRRAGFSG